MRGSTPDNLDAATVEGFGREWRRYDQTGASAQELQRYFDSYFHIFPWQSLPPGAAGFDLGCGSGRWAAMVAPRLAGGGRLICVDASGEALDVARRNLAHLPNVEFLNASVDRLPIAPGSMDFGYSLGVLHHVPDTAAGLVACVEKLKPGAPFLVYLYYAFDNRPAWYRALWRASDSVRRVISRLTFDSRVAVTSVIAATVYWPAARLARLGERLGLLVGGWPLSTYRNSTFYTMRTDSLDRFGTRLEQRFTRDQIARMMDRAGLERVTFSPDPPFWCAVGYRR